MYTFLDLSPLLPSIHTQKVSVYLFSCYFYMKVSIEAVLIRFLGSTMYIILLDFMHIFTYILNMILIELTPRPIQSISCKVCLSCVVLFPS